MITDLVKTQHLNALAAIENHLNEEAAAAVTQMIEEIDHRIDHVLTAMGTWIIEGGDVAVAYETHCWGYEELQDTMEMCMAGDFQGDRPELSEGDVRKLAELGHFLEWCLQAGACFEVTVKVKV